MQGLLTRFALDPAGADWLVAGTRKGVVGLWDMRFQVLGMSTRTTSTHSGSMVVQPCQLLLTWSSFKQNDKSKKENSNKFAWESSCWVTVL